jgi:hypothetical protein
MQPFAALQHCETYASPENATVCRERFTESRRQGHSLDSPKATGKLPQSCAQTQHLCLPGQSARDQLDMPAAIMNHSAANEGCKLRKHCQSSKSNALAWQRPRVGTYQADGSHRKTAFGHSRVPSDVRIAASSQALSAQRGLHCRKQIQPLQTPQLVTKAQCMALFEWWQCLF